MNVHTSPPVLLEVRNLNVVRGGTMVLDIPRLDIHRGQVFALIGPNGTGKSSLLLTLACLLKPFHGQIIFRNREIDLQRGDYDYRRNVAMVFQEPLLFDATVFDNVAAGLKLRRIGRKEINRIVHLYLDLFGIAHLAKRSARRLSGGEAQRTSLARAFATEPEIIFLDEPFSSLDPPTREGLTGDLENILKKTRTTAVIATHDQTEALRLADRIAVMNAGRIVQVGSVAEVMNRPVDEFVASFVGVETVLPGHVIRTSDGTFVASVEGGEIHAVGHVEAGEKVLCCIRPENVTLFSTHAHAESSARNVFRGKISKISSLGLFHRVCLDCGFELVAYVTRQSVEEMELKTDMQIIASVKAMAVHVIRRKKLQDNSF